MRLGAGSQCLGCVACGLRSRQIQVWGCQKCGPVFASALRGVRNLELWLATPGSGPWLGTLAGDPWLGTLAGDLGWGPLAGDPWLGTPSWGPLAGDP